MPATYPETKTVSDLKKVMFENRQGMHFQARNSTHCRHTTNICLARESFLELSLSRELKHVTAERNKFHLPYALDKAVAKSSVQNMHTYIT